MSASVVSWRKIGSEVIITYLAHESRNHAMERTSFEMHNFPGSST